MGKTTRIAVGDLGGTNFRGGIVEYGNETPIFNEDTYISFETKGLDIRQIFERGFGEIIDSSRKTIHGLGLDVAGPVADHSTLLNAPNLESLNGQTPANLGKMMKKVLHMKGVVCNDLEAALAGEVEAGSLKRKKKDKKNGGQWALLENLGTGYGGARLFNGIAVAAEPGHVWYPDTEKTCGCGKNNCMESMLSGKAVEHRVVDECARLNIQIPQNMKPCAFADQEAQKGSAWAVDLYTDVATRVGHVWGSKLNDCPLMTDIVYMGSFLQYAMKIELFRQTVREEMIARSMFPSQHQNVRISEVSAPMHEESGQPLGPLIGTASIWMRESSK